MTGNTSFGPPKPQFALAVAVVGHRPNRLPPDAFPKIETDVRDVLRVLRDAAAAARAHHPERFAAGESRLTLISSLAEGADRIGAEAGLALGFDVAAVLPFPVSHYETTFAAADPQFRALLESSDAVVLHGSPTDEAGAYEAASRAVVDGADVLLAIWDGGPSAGRGGTTETIERAVRQGLPVIHVDACGRAAARLLWSGFAERATSDASIEDLAAQPLERAADAVRALLVPELDVIETRKLEEFFGEQRRTYNARVEMPLLLALLGLRRPRKTDWRPDPPEIAAHQLASVLAESTRVGAKASASLAAAFAAFGWADSLGVRYAQIFRSAYSLNFVLAAVAVLLAVLPLVTAEDPLHWPKWPFVLAEVGCVLTVIVNTFVGTRRRYHARWLECREVAERLRAGLPLWLLGRRVRATQTDGAAWTSWYTSALFRAAGHNVGVFDHERLARVRAAMVQLAADQGGYHEAAALQLERTEHRIGFIGHVCFGATLAVAVAYLVSAAVDWGGDHWAHFVTALSAGLPACGAACFGVRIIGDFAANARRSRRTQRALDALRNALDGAPASAPRLAELGQAMAGEMLGDISHWRLGKQTRQLTLPG